MLPKYQAPTYQGSRCKNGHIGIRYVATAACLECSVDYAKQRRADPKVREQLKAVRNAWRKANAEKHAASKKRHAQKHRAKLNAKSAARWEAQRNSPMNVAVRLLRTAKSLNKQVRRQLEEDARRDKVVQAKALRYAASMISGAAGEPLTIKQLRARVKRGKNRAKAKGVRYDLKASQLVLIGESQRWACAYCGHVGDLVLDHIKPLSKGGAHTESNVQWLCNSHNKDKLTRSDADYRRLAGIPSATAWDVL